MVKKALGFIGFVLLLWLTGCHPDEPRWNTTPSDAMASTVWLLAFGRVDVGPKIVFVEAKGCRAAHGGWEPDAFITSDARCAWGEYIPDADTAYVSKKLARHVLPHELAHAYRLRVDGDACAGHDGFGDPDDVQTMWMRAYLEPAEQMMLTMLQGEGQSLTDR